MATAWVLVVPRQEGMRTGRVHDSEQHLDVGASHSQTGGVQEDTSTQMEVEAPICESGTAILRPQWQVVCPGLSCATVPRGLRGVRDKHVYGGKPVWLGLSSGEVFAATLQVQSIGRGFNTKKPLVVSPSALDVRRLFAPVVHPPVEQLSEVAR